jgi:cold shock CspA family protein
MPNTPDDTVYEGIVTSVKLDRGFGFISAPGRTINSPDKEITYPDCYFNMKALRDGLFFEEQLLFRRVKFMMRSGKGKERPKAIEVRPAD